MSLLALVAGAEAAGVLVMPLDLGGGYMCSLRGVCDECDCSPCQCR